MDHKENYETAVRKLEQKIEGIKKELGIYIVLGSGPDIHRDKFLGLPDEDRGSRVPVPDISPNCL